MAADRVAGGAYSRVVAEATVCKLRWTVWFVGPPSGQLGGLYPQDSGRAEPACILNKGTGLVFVGVVVTAVAIAMART